ncbi:MobA family protein, partial (plasmid) [Bombilactobacillus mellifer]
NPKFAVKQMSATRKAWQTQGKQVTRVIQSFPSSDLSAANPDAWVKANHMGLELAQQAFKDYQVAIYTHIDGVGHKIHNHLVINMPNLKTGKKYHAYRDWEKIAAISNAITQAHGYSVPHNQALERRTMAERQLANKQAYVWKDDLRQRIDAVMQDPSVSSFKTFSE